MSDERKIQFPSGKIESVSKSCLVQEGRNKVFYFWSEDKSETTKSIFFELKTLPRFTEIDPSVQKTRGLYFCNVLKNLKRKTLQTSLQALKRQKAVGVVGHVNEKPILSQVLKQLNCKKSAASITQPNKIPTDSVTQPPDTEQVEPIKTIDNIIQPVPVVKSVEKECGNCDRLNVVLQKQQKLISQYKEKMKAYEE